MSHPVVHIPVVRRNKCVDQRLISSYERLSSDDELDILRRFNVVVFADETPTLYGLNDATLLSQSFINRDD